MPVATAPSPSTEGSAAPAAGLPPAQAAYLRLAGAEPAGGAPAGDGGRGVGEAAALLGRLDADGWATLRALARRDGVTAPVWGRIQRIGVLPPPELAMARRREARVAEFQALRMGGAVAAVVGRLTELDVRPVLLKGAGLTLSAYAGGFAARPMSDLDLLVPADASPIVQAALLADGWRPERDGAISYAEHQHDVPLVSPEGVVVELHHDLLPAGHPFAFDGTGVLARARRVPAPWGDALVPSTDDQLLHCATHFAWSHELRWGAWRAIADVAALAGPGARMLAGADGERVAAAAEAARAGSALYWLLRLGALVGGVAVPSTLLARLRPPLPAAREAWLARHFAQQLVHGAATVPSTTVSRRLWEWGMQPAASGHGMSRPWRHRGLRGAGEAPGSAGVRPLGRRLLAQLGRLPAWRQWWAATRVGRA